MSLQVRSPAVAGRFYPGQKSELDSAINDYLDENTSTQYQHRPQALIVPHAGYIYSAPIAASAYKQIIPYAQSISKVVLLGPSHRVLVKGIATSSAQAFETPLGKIPLDRESIDKLKQFSFVHCNDSAHDQEHSLEVQLPFLQKILPDFSLVPLLLGQVDDQQVSDVINSLWQEKNTLFLISSDLSHYLDYQRAQKCDQFTCDSIEALETHNFHYEQACGRSAIVGLLLSAKQHGLQVKTLDCRNSGDTAGDHKRVVGYGAWAFY